MWLWQPIETAPLDGARVLPVRGDLHSMDAAVGASEATRKDLSDMWKPIKTAPKNRTVVLVHVFDSGKTYTARYFGTWRIADTNECILGVVTHWMPLPEPPSEEKQGAK